MRGIEYRGVTSVDGPIVVVQRTENVFYNETVCVRDRQGEKRLGPGQRHTFIFVI